MIKKLFYRYENDKQLTVKDLKELIKDLPDDMPIKMDIDTGETSFTDDVKYIQISPGESGDVLKIQNW